MTKAKSQLRPERENMIKSVILKLLGKGLFAFEMPTKNTKDIHILCTNIETMNTVGIRVATTSCLSNRRWLMEQNKIKNYRSNSLFFIFIGINETSKTPDFYIVPGNIVLDYTDKEALEYLGKRRKNGELREDTGTRKFRIFPNDENKYLNNWSLLGLD